MAMYYTVHVEQLASIQEEIETLANAHWEEVPFGNFGLEMKIKWDAYAALEASGNLLIVTARQDYTLVGYIVLLADEMIRHEGVMQAVTDSFYIDPDHRGKGVFRQLLKAAEGVCKHHGIRFLTVGLNPQFKDLKPDALEPFGYQPTETMVTKEIR